MKRLHTEVKFYSSAFREYTVLCNIYSLATKNRFYSDQIMIFIMMANTEELPGIELRHLADTDIDAFVNMDDRGLDIIAGKIETIKPVYTKFKNWILESNRDEIDVVFNY